MELGSSFPDLAFAIRSVMVLVPFELVIENPA
jgi:hypothetical protein